MMPDAPNQKFFEGSKARISYYVWEEEAGPEAPTLFFVHATGFHARCWDKTIAALPEGFNVIAIDLRGHGGSSNVGKVESWREPAEDVKELVSALGLQRIIGVGHSMGGHCLVQVAAALPDQFQRLVLVDPVMMDPQHYVPGGFNDRGRAEDYPVARRRNHWTGWEEMFERFKDRHPYSLWRPDVLEDYCRYGLTLREDGDGYELACPPVIESSVYVTSAGTDIYDLVAGITVPVTVIRARKRDFDKAGVMDFAASPTWPELAGAFRKGRDVYLPELTHFIPMQDPDLMAKLILET